MKQIAEYIEEVNHFGSYSKEDLEKQFKKYAEDLIDFIAGNWSPIIVDEVTGYKRFTYTTFEEYDKVRKPFPPDNIYMGRETFETLKKYIK